MRISACGNVLGLMTLMSVYESEGVSGYAYLSVTCA